MKKVFFVMCLFGFIGYSLSFDKVCAENSSDNVSNNDLNQSYPEEAKRAGYTYDQYKSIIAIPKLPSENIIEDNSYIQSRATSPSDQQKVVNEAKKYIGVPYLWGGTTPAGFDCSGLVQYVFKNSVGINLPRTAAQQGATGKEVSLNSLLPGDILFFVDNGETYHDAIYIGNNQFIHSPEPGESVQVTSMQYFAPSFARRVLDDNYNPIVAKGSLDTFQINAREISLGGWHIASNSNQGPYSFIFVMDADTGAELYRQPISRLQRNDVGITYPEIIGSNKSGFSVKIQMRANFLGKKLQIMSRYATQPGGNGEVSDFYYPQVKKTPTRLNTGSLDSVTVNPTSVHLSGWHLSNYADNNTFRFLILIDQETGKEIKRQTFVSTQRLDVGRVYTDQIFANNCGFNVTIDTSNIKGKSVKIISRYALDGSGSQIIEDYLFDKVIKL